METETENWLCGVLWLFCCFFNLLCFHITKQVFLLFWPSCDCKLKKWKSSHLNYGSLKENSILTMSALTGDCLDWTCRKEAAQCLLLLIPVVWLLPDVLPNSAVPAKHGNQTFKNSLIKQALVPFSVGTTITSHYPSW